MALSFNANRGIKPYLIFFTVINGFQLTWEKLRLSILVSLPALSASCLAFLASSVKLVNEFDAEGLKMLLVTPQSSCRLLDF